MAAMGWTGDTHFRLCKAGTQPTVRALPWTHCYIDPVRRPSLALVQEQSVISKAPSSLVV